MLATSDIQLVEETAHELRAQGQEERARAIEAVLAAALSTEQGQGGLTAGNPNDYLTPAQAARSLGISVKTLRGWIAGGQLPTELVGGQTLIARRALHDYLDQRRAAQPQPRPRTPAEIEAARRREEFIMSGLPADKLARLEALHEKMEDGAHITRAEKSEMVALEREITTIAGNRLEEWIERARPGGS